MSYKILELLNNISIYIIEQKLLFAKYFKLFLFKLSILMVIKI